MKDFAKSIVCNTKAGNSRVGNEKAISSTLHINDYGVEVGQWSWDWQGKAPDENKQKEIERKIKSYVQQINKNVPAGDNDERDEVFSKLDKFVRAQGLNKKTGNSKCGNADVVKDGNTWVVLYAEGTKSKEFDSEAEAKKFAAQVGNSKVGNKKIKGSYVTIDTSTGRVTFDDFAGKSFDLSRIDSSAGYELRVMQQQINDFKKALEEAKSLAKQNGMI